MVSGKAWGSRPLTLYHKKKESVWVIAAQRVDEWEIESRTARVEKHEAPDRPEDAIWGFVCDGGAPPACWQEAFLNSRMPVAIVRRTSVYQSNSHNSPIRTVPLVRGASSPAYTTRYG